jgi:hypothetical protein
MDTANNQGASANIRLRWNYRPDSDLYVIYTAGQRFILSTFLWRISTGIRSLRIMEPTTQRSEH